MSNYAFRMANEIRNRQLKISRIETGKYGTEKQKKEWIAQHEEVINCLLSLLDETDERFEQKESEI